MKQSTYIWGREKEKRVKKGHLHGGLTFTDKYHTAIKERTTY
jgi:hypothetical protein